MTLKRWIVGLLMLGTAAIAAAQAPHRPPRPMPAGERSGFVDRRDFQQDERREDRREPRLSPEERRQLRRDIHDAGRDLYRDRPPRRNFRDGDR